MIREDEPKTIPVMPPVTMLDSTTLLGGAREVLIRHGAEAYRLKLTQNDRLILTK